MTMIETHELTRRFKKTVAVDRLDLTIGQGETFGFIGPNGAGKTTTIQMLATLLGWPGGGEEVLLESFSEGALPERPDIAKVELMGSGEEIQWQLIGDGLRLSLPGHAPDEMAVVIKISLDQ